jgi:shikimate dehydrogenase
VIDQIDIDTRLVGLLGGPVSPGSSPEIYNAAFDALSLNWRCVPLLIRKGQLREALVGLRALGLEGAELTGTYQRDALNLVDELSSAAEVIGTVDFLKVNERGWLVGDNMRWLSFLAALRTLVPSLNGLRPLIIGAGDAARSVAYALTREGLPLTIVDERMDLSIELVHRLRHVADEHSFSVYRWPQDLEEVGADANLIVNATNIGVWPDVERSPWPVDMSFRSDAVVIDLVAWPSETRLLRQAQAGGAGTVSGLWLSVFRAALIFERWTGHPAPTAVMWDALGQSFSQHAPLGLS